MFSIPSNQCCVNNGGFGMKFPFSGDEQETQCADERIERRSIPMALLFSVAPGPVASEAYVPQSLEDQKRRPDIS